MENYDNTHKILTKTGPIRKGFDYQDACAAFLFVKWLRYPAEKKWVKLEAKECGFLDDIVFVSKDNTLFLKQIKYSCHPETPQDEWSLESILKEPQGKKTKRQSLFKRWFLSWQEFREKKSFREVKAELLTNRKASENIINVAEMCDNSTAIIIDIKKLKKLSPEHYQEMLRQIKPYKKKHLRTFFNNFKFNFDHYSLERMWTQTEVIFKELGGSGGAWLAFKEKIREWAIEQDKPSKEGLIKIEDLRSAAGWEKLKALNQEFSMPDDFELFDERIEKKLISDFKKRKGGLHILYGLPGVGKSTFLSHLYKKLEGANIPVLKHHYFLTTSDPDFYERLEHERAEEGLKNEIYQKFRDLLGEHANQNQKQAKLQDWLSAINKQFNARKQALVIIVDGLDHVKNYSDIKNLNKFLMQILPCLEEMWIVLGTRLMSEENLPPIIYEHCSFKQWIEVKPFSKSVVANLIRKNIKSKKLRIQKDRYIIRKFTNKFYQLTEGHPLHIRYSLEILFEFGKTKNITDYDLANLPPYQGNIEKYYNILWSKLRQEGKSVAILIAGANFFLKGHQVFEVLVSNAVRMDALLEGFGQIKHLLKEIRRGVTFFHTSFSEYIRQTQEFQISNPTIKKELRNWLTSKAPEELCWQQWLRLEYELGNYELVLSNLTKDWVIEAIEKQCSLKLINEHLSMGIDAALQQGNFSKGAFLGLLLNVVDNITVENEDDYEKLIMFLLKEKDGKDIDRYIFEENIPSYSSSKLNALATLAEEKGRMDILEVIFEELNTGYDRDEEYSMRNRGQREITLSKVVAYLNIEPKRVLNWIRKFDNSVKKEELLSCYVFGLLKARKFTIIENLISKKISQEEKNIVLNQYTKYCFENKIDISGFILKNGKHIVGLQEMLLLAVLNKLPGDVSTLIPEHQVFPLALEDYKSKEVSALAITFFNCYTSALILSCGAKKTVVEHWIKSGEFFSWSREAAKSLVELGMEHGEKIKNGINIKYSDLIDKLKDLHVLDWREDRDIYGIYKSFRTAAEKVFNLLKNIKRWQNDNFKIAENEFIQYCDSDFFGKYVMLKNLAYEREPFLEEKAYVKFITEEEKSLKNDVIYFRDRVEQYVDLAHLAGLHKDSDRIKVFTKKAILNMLAYGAKDAYHSDVLECVEACHKAGSKKGDSWLKRIAPLIEQAENYTEGAKYLQIDLAEKLALINPESLKSYYIYHANNENLFLAQDIFPFIVSITVKNNEIDKAVLKTAIDRESIEKLQDMAKKNPTVETILNENREYFNSLVTFPPKEERGTNCNHSSLANDLTDYKSIAPSNLKNHLLNIKDLYQRNRYLSGWSQCWLSEEGEEEAYKITIDWIEETGIEKADHEVLDLLYPLAFKFENKEKSFFLLCNAHTKGYGWSGRFFSRKEAVVKRWDFLKQHFPEKFKDFCKETLTKVDREGNSKFVAYLPVPRGVEFMTFFNVLDIAEQMTEVAVTFAEDLMADLSIPKLVWQEWRGKNSLDVLLERFKWPSPLVRERAATALCNLISNEETSQLVVTQLLKWGSLQGLESITVMTLLPFVKSARLNKCNGLVAYKTIKDNINNSSINSEFLLREVALAIEGEVLKEEEFVEEREPENLESCPKDYKPNKFFLRTQKAFLPPIHVIRAEKIEKNTGFKFIQQWAWDADRIRKKIGIEESLRDVMDFMGGRYQPSMPAFSSKMSEIYRSAFLRTLFLCYKENKIPKGLLFKWTFSLCPIDINFWEINERNSPGWWPGLSQKSNGKIDISQGKILTDLESLLDKLDLDENKIVGLHGPAKPFDGWHSENLGTKILVVPFAYEIKGAQLPSAKEIGEVIAYSPVIEVPSITKKPFCFFEQENMPLDESNVGGIKVKDAVIFPLVARIHTHPINYWKACIGRHASFGIAENLLNEGLKQGYEANNWFYMFNEEKVIISYAWNIGIIERHNSDFDAPSGQIIEIKRTWLKKILDEQKLRVGYFIKMKFIHRQYLHEKASIYEEDKLLNFSPIIVQRGKW